MTVLIIEEKIWRGRDVSRLPGYADLRSVKKLHRPGSL
jgi:hypothetical protein